MSKRTGIWIDKAKAYVITVDGDQEQINEIPSGIETRPRIPGQGKEGTFMGGHHLDPQKNLEEREKHQVERFLDQLIDQTGNTDKLVLFGPAQMKEKLASRIKERPAIADKLVGVHTADSMTENQMKAWVREHFKSN